jgi:HAMP domain-containing protein
MDKVASNQLPRTRTTLALRYYLAMLSLALVVLALAAVSISVSGHLHHLWDLVLGTGVVLVALNVIGARILFAPILRYLDGQVDIDIVRPRIRKLPIASAGWACLLVVVHMSIQFYFHHVWYVRNAPNLIELLIYPSILIAIFAIYMGFFIYFLIGDYTARLREEIFARRRMLIEPGAGRMLYKLIFAFLAVSVVPLSLLFYRLYFFDDFPHLQGLETAQFIQIDILAAAFLISIVVIFISRNLTRPVTTLLSSMNRLSAGDMQSRAPVVSDDEIGNLSVGFK